MKRIIEIVSGWGWYLNTKNLNSIPSFDNYCIYFDEFQIKMYGNCDPKYLKLCIIIRKATILQCLNLVKNFETVKQNVIKILKTNYNIEIIESIEPINFIQEILEY